MGEEEFGADTSRCTGFEGGLIALNGERLEWETVGEKLKKEVLEDEGDRLGGKEKWQAYDAKGEELAYMEKEGENQGEGGGLR